MLFTKTVVNCSVFSHIPKLPGGFEFFPCLFNTVSPENYGSMKLKKCPESSTGKPFNAGALMALRGLPGPEQLHPGPTVCPGLRTPWQLPGAVRACPREAAAGLDSIPRAGLHPQGGACCLGLPWGPQLPHSWPGWWDRDCLGTLCSCRGQGLRKPAACVTPWHS